MVKILQRTAKKRYLNKKRVYNYTRQSVCILKKFHAVTDQFLEQDLTQNITVQANSQVITLSPKKTA